MEKTYHHQTIEKRIYSMWEEGGYFTPKIIKGKKPFTIIMPPPNANAPLHIGHGLVITLEDIMIRYHRMKGDPTLWLPGADHAGILTQVTFERKLAKKGKTRYDLGRKEFFSTMMKFTLKNKKTMEDQIRALGASCDWTRNSFTLDPQFDKPIYTVFKKLYDKNLIYRDKRMINWCSRCQTALSDLEVQHREEKSKLWYIRYPLADSVIANFSSRPKKGNYIIVATTRPETMLGDTAVAVHPKDKRYQNLIGQTVILPLMNREIPIIADELVDPEFGTGAVKITPAHDPVDFEIGQKHHLKSIQVIAFDNQMTPQAGQYAALSVKEARKKVIADLQSRGLLQKEKDYLHSVGHCERCQTVIEPLISLQWFIKIKPLADPAIRAVKNKKIKIIPPRFEKIYFNWLENIKDWCLSRQLWWGHQLPVWYCGSQKLSSLQKQMNKTKKTKGCGKIIVSVKPPQQCPKCGNTNLIRDPDTLDTWFSSGQWPFNTLGWLKNEPDFQYFYPTTVMETGYEILFFWVARMIMLGLYATRKEPFKTVYLHGMVRDAFGKKMSKSRPETCIDPIETINKYGADALRMALILGNTPGTDSSLTENKIKGMRNFANKVWNAARFGLTQINANQKASVSYPDDKWILTRTNQTIEKVTKDIDNFRFDLATEEIYQFFWHEFCDKYIEKVKPRLKNSSIQEKYSILYTLFSILSTSLRLLHPFMPFVTEEIYQKFKKSLDRNSAIYGAFFQPEALIISPWPKKFTL